MPSVPPSIRSIGTASRASEGMNLRFMNSPLVGRRSVDQSECDRRAGRHLLQAVRDEWDVDSVIAALPVLDLDLRLRNQLVENAVRRREHIHDLDQRAVLHEI